MRTATQLLANCYGIPLDEGEHRCFFCGASCDGGRPLYGRTREVARAGKVRHVPDPRIKSTFTDWPSVACPASDFCCAGCDLAMREKATDVPGREGRPQKMRNYSWVLAAGRPPRALTKADRAELRAACLDPPDPPYAIALAETGQRHVLFRTPVNGSRDPVSVRLDAARIDYRVAALRDRLRLAHRLAQLFGVSRLASPAIPVGAIIRAAAEAGDEAADLAAAWERVRGEPLSALAIFLTSKPED